MSNAAAAPTPGNGAAFRGAVRQFFAVAAFILASPAAHAGDPWTGGDTARQTAFSVLAIADCLQTRNIARHPEKYYERNTLVLPRHPTVGQVNNRCAIGLVGHAAVSYLLPRGWREGWQYVWIGVEAQTVHHNYYVVGLRFGF